MNSELLFSLGRGLGEEPIRGRADFAGVLRLLKSTVRGLWQRETDSVWLRENRWLAEAEASEARARLKKAGRLRRLGAEREPLVYTLARRYVEAAEGEVTAEGLSAFLRGFQAARELGLRESWALGGCLRAALVLWLAASEEERVHRVGFTSLRLLQRLDLAALTESLDPAEALLRRDKLYPLMDEETRFAYRLRVARLAERRHQTEAEVAAAALKKADGEHIGFALFPQKEPAPGLYIGLNLLLTGLFAALFGPLALLPGSELAKRLLDGVLLRLHPPRRTPAMALKEGIPKGGKTLAVIVSLLASPADGEKFAALLRDYAITNRDAGENLLFGLLADLPEGNAPEMPEDRAILQAAQEAVRKLGPRFFLLVRGRKEVPSEGIWRGHERKRGAIGALLRLLSGEESGLTLLAGERTILEGTQFLLTLDADSRLAACGARRLVAAALHPLNRPVLDAKRGRVLSGSGILQPRLSVALSSASATGFALLFAGQGGMDPYSGAVSELWQDLFGKSTFTGKGLMNVPLARRVLEGAFPENAILSHDILEGALLGCATEGRAEVTESFPGKVGSYYSRLDRWVRGDWQNIRFLGRKSPLTRLDRWKLFDNLRRSLVPVGELAALLACLIGGKAFLPPALFTLAVLLAEFWETAAGELMRRDGTLRPRTSATLLHGPSGAGLRALASLLLLPQEAWVRLRAAATALFRMTVSRRYLLRWTTAAEAERGRADTLWGGFARYPALWLAGLAVLALGQYPFWGVGWLFAPALAVLLSRPLPQKSGLGGAERHFLLRRAEELWRFFEEQLTPEDHFLPPDNVSADSVAHRTSPTNIGFALTSCAAAEALGLTERAKATELMEEILATLEPLPKWRGHLPNWLDTRTLAPLAPVFYSAVDSGNLCAALLTAAGALESWGREESARRARRLAEETDFRALYDEKRGLLHIGYDPAKGERSESYYDLYASEARLTAYVAIALGQLPRRHWSRLSRALVGEGGYRGAVSWTGTMFEYLMPELFLPLVPNSFQWDSAAFAVRCQKKANHDLPWGISESAFWRAEGWGYRAHGVRQLALSRGEKQDRVIAPYATYLALPIAGGEAVENLRGLWEAGYRGVYGLYEAVDYTEEGEARPVPIFMAHHVGMSLAAAANALTKNALKEFFLRDARMFAWQELLSERVPISEPLMGKLPPAVRAARPAERRAFEERPAVLDALEPMLLPLRAGDFRLWVLENGKTKALFGDTLLCRWEPGARGAGGMALTLEAEGETLPLTPWPQYRRDCTYETALRPGEAVFRMRRGGVEALLTIRVSPEGEERVVTVRGLSGEAFLSANLEPALTRERDYSAHPPFHRLTLRYSLVRGGLLMERRGGVSAVLSLEGARYATEGDALLHYTPTPLITARAPIRNGQPLRVTLTRAGQFAPSPVPTLTAAAEKLRLDAESVRAALLLTSRLQTLPRREKERFWPCGISGDRPILAALCAGGEGLRRLRGLLGIHALLWDCGVPTDLALLLTDGGDYLALQRGEAERWLREREREANGSIHFLDAAEARETMEAGANLLIDLAAPWSPPKRENRLPLPQLPQTRARRVPWKYLPDGSFTFEGLPPVAWSNLLVNPHFGALVTERGTGFLWRGNAHEERLTPWLGDPIATWGGEELELAGKGSLFAGRVTYGFGWARWETEYSAVTAFVPLDRDARVLLIEAEGRIRWCLPLEASPFEESDGLTAPRLALHASEPPLEKTGSHRAALQGLYQGQRGRGEDACLAAAWECRGRLTLTLGENVEEPEKSLARTKERWEKLVRSRRPVTGLAAFDRWLDGWAVYQILASRLWGRTGLYQNGGAFGFRDQLQDAMSLAGELPALAREQLLKAASHQYRAGDVMHWWHETETGHRGVRTRIADDYLWLPWAVVDYVNQTGDTNVLRETVPWLLSRPLEEGEADRYEKAVFSEEEDTILTHAVVAGRLFVERGVGPHGLARMLAGDWNDGMNRVGGESVWLSWFGALTLRRLAALCGGEDAAAFLHFADELTAACERAWAGDHYLRGYWADGTPLGENGEGCRVDSLAQSFAVFAGGDPIRSRIALETAKRELFDPETGLIRLFTPPFDGTGRDPGYVASYAPGFRENGGQYTHGAVWLALAFLRVGDRATAMALVRALLPAEKPTERYRGEPYVLAGDVSAAEGTEGRAGWSWYTGSAGWLWRLGKELAGNPDGQGNILPHPVE